MKGIQIAVDIGVTVTAILLNGRILPTGGVASGRVCPAACAAGFFSLVVCLSSKDFSLSVCLMLVYKPMASMINNNVFAFNYNPSLIFSTILRKSGVSCMCVECSVAMLLI